MKIAWQKAKEKPTGFRPFSLNIKFDTEEEFEEFFRRINKGSQGTEVADLSYELRTLRAYDYKKLNDRF